MRRLRGILAALALGACFAAPAAGQGSGTTGVPFFVESPDPAAAALGGASSARQAGVASLFGNPAGTWNATSDVFVAHAELDQGLRLESTAFSERLPSGGVFSLGASYAHLGDLQALDESGNATGGTVAYGAAVVRVGYAQALGEHLSGGLVAEYVYQGIDGVSGSALAGGAGLVVRMNHVDLALSADHLGTALKAGNATEDLPRTFRAGFRVHPSSGLDLLGDWSLGAAGVSQLSGGAEARVAGVMLLRAGYRRELGGVAPLSGISAGVGLDQLRWGADYGLTQDSGFGAVHRFSLHFRFDPAP